MTKEEIEGLIEKSPTALLSSVDVDGFPNTKAMLAPRKREGLKTFWFTTNTSSRKVSHFRQNPKACVYFYDGRNFRGVTLLGTIRVLEDQPSREMIWRAGDELYYPQGITDPDYCVLEFTAHAIRTYANFQKEDLEV